MANLKLGVTKYEMGGFQNTVPAFKDRESLSSLRGIFDQRVGEKGSIFLSGSGEISRGQTGARGGWLLRWKRNGSRRWARWQM